MTTHRMTGTKTYRAQTRNSRANVVLEFRGKRQILTDWATEIGINRITLTGRIRLGWPVSRALTEPVRTNSRGMRK